MACGLKAPPQPPVRAQASPVGEFAQSSVPGVDDPRVAALLDEHWQTTMRRSPLWASATGDHRYRDKLPDNSTAAEELARADRSRWIAAAETLLQGELSEVDRTSLELFALQLETWERTDLCAFEAWSVNPRDSPLGFATRLAELAVVNDAASADALTRRFQALPTWIDREVEHLRRGVADGLFANAESTRRVIEMIDGELATSAPDSPMMAVELLVDDPEAVHAVLLGVIQDEIRPALKRYADFLRTEIIPNGRSETESGLSSLPLGEACYRALIFQYTTLEKDPHEIHQTGISELVRIHSEMGDLGAALFDTDDFAAIAETLRTDPAMFFDSEAEVEAKATAALDLAKARMAEAFAQLPRADCFVERIPDYEAPFTTIAYYWPAAADGSRPGTYFINTYEPTTRSRYDAEVLAFHEAIPGHHLQLAISKELAEMPPFRRESGITVFVEGWALYAEQLADELGWYTDDIDRLGMLGFEAWRAARLVVDTGIHAMGWSREQAVAFLLENTILPESNVRNEVDRYIATPGQALAYKTGQMEIWRLRREAEAQLGDQFDLKSFHTAVLGGGAVSIPVLERRVHQWISTQN